jgi:DNA-binding MarR family transcriptional regulator
MSALLVLLALAAQGEPLTMREAAKFANVSTAAMTGTVDRLVVLALVERRAAEDDRRKVLVALTPKGAELMGECLLAVTRP